MNNQNEENRITKSKDIVIKYVNLLILLFISYLFLLVFYRSFRVFSVYIYIACLFFSIIDLPFYIASIMVQKA